VVVSLCLGEFQFFIKLYLAFTALAYLNIMITSFFFPPPLVYYFIDIFDKTIKTKITKEVFESYCLKASVIWCVFYRWHYCGTYNLVWLKQALGNLQWRRNIFYNGINIYR
jgi:hypothetical protein